MLLHGVLDVESTGFPNSTDRTNEQNRIVELSILVLNESFEVVGVFDSLINPERRIPLKTQNIHRISDSDVLHAPTFQEVLPEILSIVDGLTHIVAHNAEFDLRFLSYELARCNARIPNSLDIICTLDLARKHVRSATRKLVDVACHLGIAVPDDLHQAFTDTVVTARVFSELAKSEARRRKRIPVIKTHTNALGGNSEQLPRKLPSEKLAMFEAIGLTTVCTSEDMQFSRERWTDSHSEPSTTREQTVQLADSGSDCSQGFQYPRSRETKRGRPGMNESTIWTLELMTTKGLKPAEIAKERGLKPSTIFGHLRTALEYGALDIHQIIAEEALRRIENAWVALPLDQRFTFRLTESLREEFPYDELACAITWLIKAGRIDIEIVSEEDDD